MKRKIPIWSLLLLLLFLSTCGLSIYLASQQNNIKTELSTVKGDNSALAPIQLSSTILDSNTVEDYWDVTFDFKNNVVNKAFHDGVYTEIVTQRSTDLNLMSTIDDHYYDKGTGTYYIKDDYATLPFELTCHDSILPVIKEGESYPYLQVTPSDDWCVEITRYADGGSSTSNISCSYLSLDSVMVNGRLFYTMDLSNYSNKAMDVNGEKPIVFSGTTGIFEIDLSYKPSEIATYEELITNRYGISITNESSLRVVGLVGLDDQNAVCLITLTDEKDLHFTIFQLDTNSIVFDEVVYSFPEAINTDYEFNCFYKNGTFSLSTINSIQLLSDEEVNKLHEAAISYDTEYDRLHEKEYEEYDEASESQYDSSYWDAYNNAFKDERLFVTIDVDSKFQCSFLSVISSSDLDPQGRDLELSELTYICDMLYVDETLYILYSNYTSYSNFSDCDLYLLAIKNQAIAYFGRMESDVLEDYTIGYPVENSDYNPATRTLREYKLLVNPDFIQTSK